MNGFSCKLEYAAMVSAYIDGKSVGAFYGNDSIREGYDVPINWEGDIEELRQKIHY